MWQKLILMSWLGFGISRNGSQFNVSATNTTTQTYCRYVKQEDFFWGFFLHIFAVVSKDASTELWSCECPP